MIRITTGGVLKNYRSNLMKSYISQSKNMTTIMTQRTFNSYAEDPAAAAKAFRLRKSRMTAQSQSFTCNDTLKKYETGFSSLQSIDDVLDTKDGQYGMYMKTLKGTTLSMLNDPEGDAREQLNKVLDQMSEMLVQNLNQKYGDNFIFAGADGHNVPFEVKELADGTKQLQYRGVPVDAAVPNVFGGNTPVEVDQNGNISTNGGYYLKTENTSVLKITDYNNDPNINILKGAGGTPQKVNADGKPDSAGDYYLVINGDPKDQVISKGDYDEAAEDVAKLDYLSKEKLFVDIGLGFQENENGQLIESSGYNAALIGINFLGYGMDGDGDPKNLYSLVQKMKEVSESVPEAGKWDTATWEEFDRLVGKFEIGCSTFKTEFTNMAASTTKLETNAQLLEDNFYNLQDQYAELEDIEPVEAINNFLWALYAYNAALKVGNSVLSQSLMDYLN